MPVDYSKSKIYCIRSVADGDKIVYVGSTTRPLSERMAEHRKKTNNEPSMRIHKKMAEVGLTNFHIELLIDFPCERKEQLLAKEGEYIRIHKLTTDGYNKNIAGRAKAEYDIEYRANFHDKLSENKKIYYENHKEQVLESGKDYRAANSEKISERKQAYYENHKEEVREYGIAYRNTPAVQEAQSIRSKVYNELNKAKLSAYNKARYLENREEKLAKNKAYKERKKAEKIAAANPQPGQ